MVQPFPSEQHLDPPTAIAPPQQRLIMGLLSVVEGRVVQPYYLTGAPLIGQVVAAPRPFSLVAFRTTGG
jgi:hypothetical protein